MRKVVILMGEAYYEGSHIIQVFDFKDLDKIVKNVEIYDCFESGMNKWEDILREDFKEKYCSGFDDYYIDTRDIIEVN